MAKPTKDKPRIKYVKKAKLWVTTYFTYNEHSKSDTQVQEWSIEKP